MKTTIEVGGFEIKIEELEGKVTVVAEQEGEVIEQFELETSGEMSGEMSDEDGEDMMPFGDEEAEEGDFGQEEADEEAEEEAEEEELEEEEEGKLESFNSFIKKRNK